MTSPDGRIPSGSASQNGMGLASWAAKTGDQWKNEQTNTFATKYETNFFDKWISNLFGGFFNGVLGLISALVYGLKGIAGGLIDLTGALKATDTKADAAVNTANGAAQTVVTVQKEIIQKIQVFDIKSPTPLYVALNRTEWPSIPWSDAMRLQLGNPSTTLWSSHNHGSSASNNTTLSSHQHARTLVNEQSFTGALQWFAFIVVPIDTPLSGLNFYARGTPSDLRTRLYLMSATGDLEALTPQSPNLASLLVSGTQTATPTTFDEAIVEAGSIVAVRFSVMGTVFLMGDQFSYIEPPVGFYPKHLSASTALASGSASPDSISESGLTWAGSFVPYVAVGNNIVVAQPKRFFEDNFDRADTGALGIGGNWGSNSRVGIRSNDVAYTDTTDGLGTIMYARALTTDYQLHGCRVGLLPNPEQNQVAYAALLFRCTQNRSTGLRVAFRRGSIILQSIANSTTFTNLVSTSRALAVGDSIQAQQGEWVGTTFYPDRVLVFHNGIEIIRTDITSATVPYGPQRRYGGLGQERTPFQNSPRIQDWFESDISDVEAA
ncbi:hypothetical protein [Rhodococcoides fascians]|uniref:hypothetical protein n=1 Tax=Rhodococcoides fascians TaxID=1828 RepID=UPI000B07813A|nr:hypothetical protein [Rhodococcus fascians]